MRYALTMAGGDTRVFTSELGDYHYQKFLQWAFVERQSKAAFARNIVCARTESNKDIVQDGLEFYAGRYGITVEVLIEAIAEMDGKKMSVSQIHQALAEKYGVQADDRPND